MARKIKSVYGYMLDMMAAADKLKKNYPQYSHEIHQFYNICHEINVKHKTALRHEEVA